MIKEKLENARIERATFRMQSGRSPTELIPRYTNREEILSYNL